MAGGDGRATRVLNVADEPSVALALSSMLTSNQALKMRDESSGLNKIYEFNYTIQGQPCEMLFTSVDGHLMNLDFQDECCRTWPLLCDPVDLYDAPLCKYVPEDKLDIKRRLQDEARNCQWLVLWLHCDADGENIAFEVVEVCKEANPQLDVWRARFSALIDREIQESVQKLTRPNQSLADVVDVRKEIDLRVGASFTSFQTTVLKRMLDLATGDEDLVLSYDRCQRLCIIESHEPNELWTINCSHKSAEGTATFDWGRKLSNKTRVEVFFDMCVKKPTATVTKARVQEKLKYPPRPLNIVELQKRALRYFEMSSEQTMKVAVDLYQAGFISYPRTETDFFSERTDLKNLYELVVRHFLACVSQPAIEVETTVDIGIAGESFVASGRMLRDKNYLDVYRFESWGGSMIPSYTIGQQFTPTMTLVSSVTRPLPLLHEADLLTFMDQAGIGNDAPMHDHIKKLLDGLYATKDSDTRISPTNLGKEIVMAYEQSSRAPQYKLQLRMWTEHDMKAIKIGTNTKAQVLKTSLQKMKECFLDYKNFAWRPTSIFKEAVDQKVMSDLLNAEEMWMGVRTHIHAFRGSQKVMPRRNLAV